MNFNEFIDDLKLQVKNNVIPMKRIDDAVRRILRVKFVMGLFENPMADLSLVNEVGSQVSILPNSFKFFRLLIFSVSFFPVLKFNALEQEHRELAREAVRKSLVLLKNGKSAYKPLLPLPKKAPKILVAGTHADNLGNQCGGWTIEWQGANGNDITSGTKYFILTSI